MTENLPAILRQLATDPAYMGGTANAQFLLMAAQKLTAYGQLMDKLDAIVAEEYGDYASQLSQDVEAAMRRARQQGDSTT